MNHLAYFALAMTDLREQEAEREIALRRKRIGDDEARTRIRDRKWAAAIHRWAMTEAAADSVLHASGGAETVLRADATPSASAERSAGPGAATIGCASA
jgi:hypothetical protein